MSFINEINANSQDSKVGRKCMMRCLKTLSCLYARPFNSRLCATVPPFGNERDYFSFFLKKKTATVLLTRALYSHCKL